ncbi:hypothetical protein FKM82_008184 [Ascaphus truei]
MTCSIVPCEEDASSFRIKENQGVPLLTKGSSSWLQRERDQEVITWKQFLKCVKKISDSSEMEKEDTFCSGYRPRRSPETTQTL